MARGSEEYSDRVVDFEDGEALDDAGEDADEDAGEAVEGSAADDSCYRADKEASEEFVDGLNERDSSMSWEMVRVLEGDASFTPSWMKPGVPGLEAVDDLVTVYADKSVGWSAEQREYVAGEVSRLLVEPTSVFVRGMEFGDGRTGEDVESLRAEWGSALADAKLWFEQAMLNGDTSRGRTARAMLNQVQRDAEGISRGEQL